MLLGMISQLLLLLQLSAAAHLKKRTLADTNLRCLEDNELVAATSLKCPKEVQWNFYYDKQMDSCYARKTFLDCPGIPGPFESLSECQNTCRGNYYEESLYSNIHPRKASCIFQRLDRCDETNSGYSWDPIAGTCVWQEFGCLAEDGGDSGNFFLKLNECMEKCAPRDGEYMFGVMGPDGSMEGNDMTGKDLGVDVYSSEKIKAICAGSKILPNGRKREGLACNVHRYKYTYDATSGECKRFISNTCQDGINVFDEEEYCQHLCIDAVQRHSK